jgi:lactoylglutathione lyase
MRSFRIATTLMLSGILACLWEAARPAVSQTDTPAPKPAAVQPNDAAPKSAAPVKKPELRRPGFTFVELSTRKVQEYAAYFATVAGFRRERNEPSYVEMVSDHGEVIFIDPSWLPKGHPFHGTFTGVKQGLGVEFGIVVADIDKAFAAAQRLRDKGWPISSGLVRRPWGVRDFRVLAPDGYYLRFTEGPPET